LPSFSHQAPLCSDPVLQFMLEDCARFLLLPPRSPPELSSPSLDFYIFRRDGPWLPPLQLFRTTLNADPPFCAPPLPLFSLHLIFFVMVFFFPSFFHADASSSPFFSSLLKGFSPSSCDFCALFLFHRLCRLILPYPLHPHATQSLELSVSPSWSTGSSRGRPQISVSVPPLFC